MQDKRTKNREKLKMLLRELFRFDHADLDFGIYKIMDKKREELERFIERDLLDVVEEALGCFLEMDREELDARLAEKAADLGEAQLDETGAVREAFRELPVAKKYVDLRRQLRQLEVAEDVEARVFDDLYRFFNRYYDQGDFLAERRYSSRDAKYCAPYNGEEVILHWANRNQYYVKTSERFTDYRFSVGEYTVWFRLTEADLPQGNIKADDHYFVLKDECLATYDVETRTLIVRFAYRALTEDEEEHYVAVHNEIQDDDKSQLQRQYVCEAIEDRILREMEPKDLKHQLGARRPGRKRSLLFHHLNRYTGANTTDYFVHRALGSFLRRELDVFLKSEVMRLDGLLSGEADKMELEVVTRARVVRQIAVEVIDFLSQIEEFQRRLFEKKKFVVQTDYCITLDRVPKGLYQEILENEKQLQSWWELYRMEDWEEDLTWQGRFDRAFLEHHPYLMIDTAFFSADFKGRVLAAFGDLDREIDGVLIQGENFQALNLLKEKYAEQVKCIYIDPPYNTGKGEFPYKDQYRHSSWLAMMADRLTAAEKLMRDDAPIFISIDDHEAHHLRILCEQVFGRDDESSNRNRFVGMLPTVQNLKGNNDQFGFAGTHEYTLVYLKDEEAATLQEIPLDRLEIEEEYDLVDEEGRYKEGAPLKASGQNAPREKRPNLYYPIWIGPQDEVSLEEREGYVKLTPVTNNEDMSWRWSKEYLRLRLQDVIVKRNNGEISLYRKQRVEELSTAEYVQTYKPKSILYRPEYSSTTGTEALKHLMGGRVYPNPKSPTLVRDLCAVGGHKNALFLDFFAGSGTTGQAVMEANREDDGTRKYILIEMAGYFDTVLRPRIQKLAFSANWKDGVPQDRNGMTQVVKYNRIESYEDALNNIVVRKPGEEQLELLRRFDDYMMHYMLDFETRDSPTLLAQEAFERPFSYTLKVRQNQESPEQTDVDLVETFHYLIGMHVRRLERHRHQGRTYAVSRGSVYTDRGIDKIVVIWRDRQELNLEEEAQWVGSDILTEPVDRVYINGPSFVTGAEPLEIVFRNLLEDETNVA